MVQTLNKDFRYYYEWETNPPIWQNKSCLLNKRASFIAKAVFEISEFPHSYKYDLV